VISQRRRIGGQRAKDEIAKSVDPQLPEPMNLDLKARRHPTAPGDAAAKGDALEIAFEVVTPGMIDTSQVVGVAAALQADEVAAMGAAVQHGMDLPVMPACDDDWGLAQKSRQIVAWREQFAGQGQKLPGRPEKDAGQLPAIDLRIGKHPVGDAGVAFGRPLKRGSVRNGLSLRLVHLPSSSTIRISRG